MAYEMELIRVTGTPEMMTGTDNFRRFVQSLLTASIEGEAGLTAEEMASLRTTDDSDCYLKITFTRMTGRRIRRRRILCTASTGYPSAAAT